MTIKDSKHYIQLYGSKSALNWVYISPRAGGPYAYIQILHHNGDPFKARVFLLANRKNDHYSDPYGPPR